MEARTFREAYGVLQDHAETLREQAEPNIDSLLSIVTESVAAYKVCKERIDAVEKALEAALTDVGGAVPGDDGSEPVAQRAPAKTAAKKSSTGYDNMDDEIPF
jgi:exodeoxyribonuclease VII small subunit